MDGAANRPELGDWRSTPWNFLALMTCLMLGTAGLPHILIRFYPVPSGMEAFKDELAGYKQGKGSVQFPLDKPMPLDLIRRMVRFRVEESRAAAAAKDKKR